MRRAYLDVCPGERRAVVTLDGLPERLWIARDEDEPAQRLGARVRARVTAAPRGGGPVFLDLGEGEPATTARSSVTVEGAALAVEIVAEARQGKGAAVRVLGPEAGPPGLLVPAPTLEQRLAQVAPGKPVTGERAREAADAAEAAALATVHALPGGGEIAIERTRALTAVDVDVAEAAGEGRAAARVNRAALVHGARLLRLKGLGGVVVFDMIGQGGAAETLVAAAKAAFEPDAPGVVFGPLSRLGLFQLAKPWREMPAVERLLDEHGAPSMRALASATVRELQRAGAGDPGGRFVAVLAPDAAEAAAAHVEALGPRFGVRADPGARRDRPDIRPL